MPRRKIVFAVSRYCFAVVPNVLASPGAASLRAEMKKKRKKKRAANEDVSVTGAPRSFTRHADATGRLEYIRALSRQILAIIIFDRQLLPAREGNESNGRETTGT